MTHTTKPATPSETVRRSGTKTMPSKKLKSCPFCGGKAKLWPNACGGQKLFVVFCLTTECSVELAGLTKALVIREWNRRADAEKQEEKT